MQGPKVGTRKTRVRSSNIKNQPGEVVEMLKRPRTSRRERRISTLESTQPRSKRRRGGEPAPVGGYANKPSAAWSVYRGNRANVKRKPEARRKPAMKKALQRGATNPGVEARAPQRAINAARRRKATMPVGARRPSKSADRD